MVIVATQAHCLWSHPHEVTCMIERLKERNVVQGKNMLHFLLLAGAKDRETSDAEECRNQIAGDRLFKDLVQ